MSFSKASNSELRRLGSFRRKKINVDSNGTFIEPFGHGEIKKKSFDGWIFLLLRPYINMETDSPHNVLNICNKMIKRQLNGKLKKASSL